MSHDDPGSKASIPRCPAVLPLTVLLLSSWLAPVRDRRDRGDVPGWVLITVMTAGLVSALWLFAGTALVDMFKAAISSVSGK